MREALFSALSRDYGRHPYAKWGGAFWRLMSLADLGVPPGHAGAVQAAANELLTEQAESVLHLAGRQ
jgi:hypothetical protein